MECDDHRGRASGWSAVRDCCRADNSHRPVGYLYIIALTLSTFRVARLLLPLFRQQPSLSASAILDHRTCYISGATVTDKIRHLSLFLCVALARLAAAQGGPPMITDDPGTPGN